MLFQQWELEGYLDRLRTVAERKVDNISEEDLLAGNPVILAGEIHEQVMPAVPVLDEAQISRPERETSGSGSRVQIRVPYAGSPDLFECRPRKFTINPPDGVVDEDSLLIYASMSDKGAPEIEAELRKTLSEVERWLGWVAEDVSRFHKELLDSLQTRTKARRRAIEQDRGVLDELAHRFDPSEGGRN
jgi:hypothetical protein